MKNFFALIAVASIGFTAVSCNSSISDPVQVDNTDTYSVAYDLKNVNFAYTAATGYTISKTFNSPLIESDVVLIFRQSGTTNGSPVWQSIPRTLFLDNGNELDYDFDFSKYDILIKAGGNYDVSTTPTYLNNQTFRVVVVPAATGKNANVDLSNYDSVAAYYHITENNVKTL